MSKKLVDLTRRHPLIAYVVLAYAFSWLVWAFAKGGEAPSPFMVWLGGFGPAISAILLTALLEGPDGLRDLLARAFIWKLSPRWYLAALGLPLAGTIALILMAVISGVAPHLQMLGTWLAGLLQHSPVLGLTLLLGVVIVAGEEFGWRGFALPRLRVHHTDLYASLGVGLMWGLWHLPDLWPFKAGHDALDLLFFMADILAASVIYTWLYANSSGSLPVVCLFHSAYDVMVIYASATIPFLSALKGYELLVLLVIAGLITLGTGRARFARAVRLPALPQPPP